MRVNPWNPTTNWRHAIHQRTVTDGKPSVNAIWCTQVYTCTQAIYTQSRFKRTKTASLHGEKNRQDLQQHERSFGDGVKGDSVQCGHTWCHSAELRHNSVTLSSSWAGSKQVRSWSQTGSNQLRTCLLRTSLRVRQRNAIWLSVTLGGGQWCWINHNGQRRYERATFHDPTPCHSRSRSISSFRCDAVKWTWCIRVHPVFNSVEQAASKYDDVNVTDRSQYVGVNGTYRGQYGLCTVNVGI